VEEGRTLRRTASWSSASSCAARREPTPGPAHGDKTVASPSSRGPTQPDYQALEVTLLRNYDV